MANSVDPDQTAPIAVCSGSRLFASILNLSVMLGNYLQQTTSADDIFICILFCALRVEMFYNVRINLVVHLSKLCKANKYYNIVLSHFPNVTYQYPRTFFSIFV